MTNKDPHLLLFDNAQSFDYFKVDAGQFDKDLNICLSKNSQKSQSNVDYMIILGGWGGRD